MAWSLYGYWQTKTQPWQIEKATQNQLALLNDRRAEFWDNPQHTPESHDKCYNLALSL